MKKITLHKGKEKSLLRYHPWVFSGAIAKMERGIVDGDIVEVCDHSGQFLAMGHFHDSSIAVRVFSFAQQLPDYEFWKQKFVSALQYRQRIGLIGNPDTNMFRLVNGEDVKTQKIVIE